MTESYDLKPLAASSTSIQQNDSSVWKSKTSSNRDRSELASVGKKQILRRSFGFLSMIGFSCTLMGTWDGLLAGFVQVLSNGGPAGSIYGYLLCWIGITSIISTLAEMASMAPTSGGQYHYAAMLAPYSCQKSLSYIAGWFTVSAWQAGFTGVAFPTATYIQGLIILNHPNYGFERWHGTLLAYAVLFLAVFVNTYLSRYLSKLEGVILIFYVLTFLSIITSLIYLAPHGTAKDVFTTFSNDGGWPSQGLSFFIGLSTFAFAFGGADGVTHMAEEIENATSVVPWSMLAAVLVNGVMGFTMLLVILFCSGDINTALASPTGFPFIEIFQQAAGIRGATVLTIFTITIAVFGTWATLASASRQLWAFSRDNGLPGSSYLSRIDSRTSLPLYAIGLTVFISLLLPLLNVAAQSALTSFISLQTTNWYISFLIPCYLMLWRRLNGSISSHQARSEEIRNTVGEVALTWGPWRMPRLVGIIVNIVACIFGTVILLFSFWPQVTPVTAQTMNFSVLMTGATTLFSLVYYLARARKTYTGPVIEVRGGHFEQL